MLNCLFILCIFFLNPYFIGGDQGRYEDSDAAFISNSNVDLVERPLLYSEVRTSSQFDAGTVDMVYATYLGKFSSSGPHPIGPFTQGTTRTIATTLDRKIGDLVAVLLQTNGSDAWLLGEMSCRIGSTKYELTGPTTWLDALDPISEELYGNGFSPNAQNTDIPTATNLELVVATQYYVYTSTGLDSYPDL